MPGDKIKNHNLEKNSYPLKEFFCYLHQFFYVIIYIVYTLFVKIFVLKLYLHDFLNLNY